MSHGPGHPVEAPQTEVHLSAPSCPVDLLQRGRLGQAGQETATESPRLGRQPVLCWLAGSKDSLLSLPICKTGPRAPPGRVG